MSSLENLIWHILGYAAIPMILLAGFILVAVPSLWLLSLTKDRKAK